MAETPSGGGRKKPASIRIAQRDIREAEKNLEAKKKLGSQTAIEAAEQRLKEARQALNRIRKADPGEERQQARRDFMEDYFERLGPEAASLARRDPELRKLFDEAVRKKWDQERFLSELKKTDWWKDPNKGSSWRTAFELEFNNPPGVWREKLDDAKRAIRDLAKSVYNITIPEDVLDQVARRYYYQGWDKDSQRGLRVWLDRQFGKQKDAVEPDGGGLTPGGEFADVQRSLRDAVRNYGLYRPPSWFETTARNILNPNSGFTEDNAWNELIAEAESMYPVFSGRLSKDRSVRDVASGYISQLARYLELNDPDMIELDDPLLQRAFTNIDEKTNNPSLMPLWKFTQEIKKDGRWQYTSNALDTYSQIGSDLARMMGFVR
jgi:hypothetical protein